MSFVLPPLAYALDALSPYLSQEALELHHGKHHQAYVSKLNELTARSTLADMPLEDVLLATHRTPQMQTVFNNAAQHWNHAFFWTCMKPGGGFVPASVQKNLERHFGSVDDFKKKFLDAGTAQFGSGWVWLVRSGDELQIVKTPNAGNPLLDGKKPLLVCDVWEHAYYVDYRNRRADYLKNFLDYLVDWQAVAERLQA